MRRSTTVVDGAVGGMLAGAVVAAWFFVLDVATSQPFHTPRLLAAALLGHESSLTTTRLVAVYTLLHLGVFAVLGIGGAWLMKVTGEVPRLLTGALFGMRLARIRESRPPRLCLAAKSRARMDILLHWL